MTTGSLKFRLSKTEEEAYEITRKYWGTFPRVQPWFQETVKSMERSHMVRYWSGRIWREEKQDDFYKGCNAQIQGGAADLISIAVTRQQKVLRYNGWGSVASIIHDETMSEVKDEYLAEAVPVLTRIMELEDIFGLPFRAEAKVGKTYGVMDDWPVGDVSQIVWQNYLPAGTDFTKLTLEPWNKKYGQKENKKCENDTLEI